MGKKDLDNDSARIRRLLRREIESAANRLIKVRKGAALGHAQRQAEFMRAHGDNDEFVYWDKIAAEVQKQLSAD